MHGNCPSESLFEIYILTFEHSGGAVKVIAKIEDPWSGESPLHPDQSMWKPADAHQWELNAGEISAYVVDLKLAAKRR